ncbi:MAG TPA: response regulator [Nitrososphaeraceae archaeon]|jgi:two-component system response regulator ChvI|nr:response regulator [Nitrososphaeraceae archaeon]
MSLDDSHDPEYKEPFTSSSISNSSHGNVFPSFPASSRNISDKEEISFSSKSEKYCVSFVDIVNSTNITAQISHTEKIGKYYSIFINTMATLARNYGAKITKNAGDSIIYYFPKTADSTNKAAFMDVIECGLTMISAGTVLNTKMYEEGLPSIDYRISADYGRVGIVSSAISQNDDLFGPTMNICSKINSKALPNQMVIGGDLYQIIKSSSHHRHDYRFKSVGEYSVGFKQMYPVYSVLIKNRTQTLPSHDEQMTKLKPVQMHSSPTTLKIPSKTDSNYKGQEKHTPNIMLIDDDPDILLTYKSILIEENCNIETFTDAQEALNHFAEANHSYYDLVLLDIRMPGINGLQLYYKLKAINMAIKIIFVSALDAADELISMLPGVKVDYDIIRKPVNRENFVNKIKAVLS